MTKKKKSKGLKQTAFRFGPKTLKQLDDLVRQRNRETGMELNRTDVLRWLISKESKRDGS